MLRYANQHKDENHTKHSISQTGRTLRLAALYIKVRQIKHNNIKIWKIFMSINKIFVISVCHSIQVDLWWLGLMFLNHKGIYYYVRYIDTLKCMRHQF